MGVAGSGKTTVGRLLAAKIGCEFSDADQFHSGENIAKMSAGTPLTDQDRMPWLDAMAAAVTSWLAEDRSHVLACSALKAGYRQLLAVEDQRVSFVYLKADKDLISARLASRQHHYMKGNMVESQFDTLEEPLASEAIVVNAGSEPTDIVEHIIRSTRYPLGLKPTS